MPKTLGIIGGLSPESTIIYYEHITREYYKQTGHYPNVVIRSVDLTDYSAWFSAGDWGRAGTDMAAIFEDMRRIGADFGLISSNTAHRAMSFVLAGTKLPILSIIDATTDRIESAGIKTVALLGTRFTMKEDFFKRGLSDRGITAVVPDDTGIEAVNRVIWEELVKGIVKDESRDIYKTIIGRLVSNGAEGVILGCTEIPLLIGEADSPVPLFDTARIHAEAAVRTMLTN